MEFTSISVSSYDAASLADKLTEKSAAGWDVVAIVPAGTNITAYLSRDTASEDAASAAGDGTAEPELIAEASQEEATTPTGVAEEVEELEPVWEPEPVAEEPAAVAEPAGWAVAPEPASTAPASDEVSPEPAPYVDTSSGYSSAQPAGAESENAGEPYVGTTTAGYDTDATTPPGYETGTSSGATTEPTPSYDITATTEPSSGDDTTATTEPSYDTTATTEPSYDTTATTEPSYDTAATTEPSSGYDTASTTEPSYDTAATTEPSSGYDTGATADSGIAASSEADVESQATAGAETTAASAAPAGWYADPSGRFELRYWDGNQWTEHVSRAGQQYTDPPVA